MGKGKGFTLIELLVVIAIIAILAAILFPVMTAAKKRAATVKCLNNLKQIAFALRQYADDNNSIMPKDGYGSINWCGSESGVGWCYPERGQIWKYTKTKDIYICPLDKNREASYISNSKVPRGLSKKDYPLSYSMNHYASEVNPDTINIPKASKFMLLIHEWRGNINDGVYVPITGNTQDIPDNVHYDGTTVAYLDGHANWDSKKNLLAERDVCPSFWIPK